MGGLVQGGLDIFTAGSRGIKLVVSTRTFFEIPVLPRWGVSPSSTMNEFKEIHYECHNFHWCISINTHALLFHTHIP